MPGTLHIFRLRAAPLTYQANYNLGAASYVQVFDADGLEEFLHHGPGLPPAEIESMLTELRNNGHTGAAVVDMAESHLAEMGFAETPSDT